MIIMHDQTGMINGISTYHEDEEGYIEFLRNQGTFCIHIEDEPTLDAIDIIDGFYIKDNKLAIRPTLSLEKTQLSIGEEVTISDVPTGAKAKIDEMEFEVNTGELTFSADEPGTYKISITSWPYKDFRAEVTVS